MGQLTVIALHIEGDAAAISAAMDAVRSELSASTAPQVNRTLSLDPSPAKERARGKVGRQAGHRLKPVPQGNGKKEPRAESFEAKALDMIRNSHQGVTSEEIYKEVGCTNIPAAYQVCTKLQRKRLVTRLDSGAWKVVNG